MDIATVIGLVGGTILIVVSILIGGSFSIFINTSGIAHRYRGNHCHLFYQIYDGRYH